MDLPNGTYIARLKETLLPIRGKNSLFYTSQTNNFVMDKNDAANNHIGKKYTHDRDKIILINSDRALIYAPLQEHPFFEPIHQDIGILSFSIITLDRSWRTSLI